MSKDIPICNISNHMLTSLLSVVCTIILICAFVGCSNTSIPKTSTIVSSNIAEQKKISGYSIEGNKVYFGKVPFKQSFLRARGYEVDNNRTASQLSAKLQCFQWLEILYQLDKRKKLSDFLNVLYYGAKKQYATAGPFLKIS